jgi:hypothetical protein
MHARGGRGWDVLEAERLRVAISLALVEAMVILRSSSILSPSSIH